MKTFFLLIFFPFGLLAQLQFEFNNNNLNSWSGDTVHYRIDSLNRLQLYAPYQSGNSTIFHDSQAIIYGKWAFDLTMDFNPSRSNYCQIHLSSDEAENGYFVRIGGSDDQIALFKKTNGQNSKIIDGPIDFIDSAKVEIRVRIERNSIGNWQVWAQHKGGQEILQGNTFDNSFVTSKKFGINSIYTSTRSQKFYFDNIYISGVSFLDTFARAEKNDIIINEILFNPVDGDNDFVEIINNSGHKINIKDMMIGNYYGGRPDNFKIISSDYLFMENQEIIVLTNSISDLLFYHPEAQEKTIIELYSMPSYNNQDGAVVLMSDSIIIDQFHYDESMHFPYLSTVDGVSLERISPNLSSGNPSHWQSASEPSGFSTPTLKNSQNIDINSSAELLKINHPFIRPNNDGLNDLLEIQLNLKLDGYIGQLIIFNDRGKLIKTVVNNQFFGTQNSFTWDGIKQNG